METARRRSTIWIATAAGLLFLFGLFWRAWRITAEPLWLDEGYSAFAAEHGWRFLWQVVPAYETHPPLYYSLLHLWTLAFGNGLAALKALGLLAGLATLPVALFAGLETGRYLGLARRQLCLLGLAFLALTALSPALVEMSREVRPYPVLILVYTTGLAALLRVARQAEAGQLRAGPVAAFFTAEALAVWLHTLGPLYGAAMSLALFALVFGHPIGRRGWMLLAAGHLIVALLYLPAFAIMLGQAPTWVQSTWLRFRPELLEVRVASLYFTQIRMGWFAGLGLVLLGLWRLWRPGGGRRLAVALLILALLPVVASIALSIAITPVFIPRTMTACVVPALLLCAIGATVPGRLWLAGLAGFLFLATPMATADLAARRGPPMQNWYGTVRWLAARYHLGDVVLSYPNEGDLPLRYAVRDLQLRIPSRPIPAEIPALGAGGWNPTGSRGVVSLPRDRLRAIARAPDVADAHTVWLMRLGANAYDVGDVFLDELIASGRRPVARWQSGPIDLIGLRRVSPGPAVPAGGGAAR